MGNFIIRAIVAALGLWLASVIVPGITIAGLGTLVAAAVIFGLVNAIVRPIVVLLTLPLTLITLGLFLLVINAAMLELTAVFLRGFTINGFVAALLGSVVVSATTWLIGLVIDRD